jgi:formylglycine-generating enzyme required for sulfatase activity
MAGEALDVFISYSRQDEALKNELVDYHLKRLQREGKINTWQDRDIEAGAEWAQAIKTNLEKADIVLLLVTRYFLASDYCYETEMQRAVQRHEEGTARVIPIILRPCSWEESEFKKLQVLPTDGKPVTSWTNPEEAFLIVEKGIRQVVDALNGDRREVAAIEFERQQELERLRQQQAAAERLAQAQKADEQRQQEQAEARRLEQERQHQAQLAAEQRQREQEAERLQQQAQQAEAERLRQAQERQQQAAERLEQERLQQQQAEAAWQAREQQKQLAVERQRQREVARQGQTVISRRQALQIIGLGGGGLIVAIATNALRTENLDNPKPPRILGSSPDDLSAVDIQSVNVDETGTITERPSGQVSAFRETLDNNVGLDMVQIPAGEFVMGSPAEEAGRQNNEGPQRTVAVPSFFMGRFQVTQAQYEAVMGQNPSRFKGADRPVESVSWDDAVAFCEKLSGLVGRTYRLPSEAEWEYACRAKTTAPFNVGPTITTDLANYDGNATYGNGPKGIARKETTDGGRFPPNAFGLHDMHGNVWEWCLDHWHDTYDGAPTDGSAWLSSDENNSSLLRGGSWGYNPTYCRSAGRFGNPRDAQNYYLGFRIVCASSWAP